MKKILFSTVILLGVTLMASAQKNTSKNKKTVSKTEQAGTAATEKEKVANENAAKEKAEKLKYATEIKDREAEKQKAITAQEEEKAKQEEIKKQKELKAKQTAPAEAVVGLSVPDPTRDAMETQAKLRAEQDKEGASKGKESIKKN